MSYYLTSCQEYLIQFLGLKNTEESTEKSFQWFQFVPGESQPSTFNLTWISELVSMSVSPPAF